MRKTPSQELFRRGSIRKSALPILETLSETPITAAEIIAQSGRASATVYRQLKKLSSQGVVEKQDGGWVLGQRQLADLEDEYGCEASAKRRKDGIDLQRRMLKYQGWRVVNGQDP